MPPEAHDEYPPIELPYFNTREFFPELQRLVITRFNELAVQKSLT